MMIEDASPEPAAPDTDLPPPADDLPAQLAEAEALTSARDNGIGSEEEVATFLDLGRDLDLALRGNSEIKAALGEFGPLASSYAASALLALPDDVADAANAAGVTDRPEAWRLLAEIGHHMRNSALIRTGAWTMTRDQSGTAAALRHLAADTPRAADPGLVQRALRLKRTEAYCDSRHVDHAQTKAAVQRLLQQATGEAV